MRTYAFQTSLFSFILAIATSGLAAGCLSAGNLSVSCPSVGSNQAFCSDADRVAKQAAERTVKVTVRLKAAGQFSSGIVIGKTGEILTVNHGLPDGILFVTVTDSDGQIYSAKVVQRSEAFDLAMLRITGQDIPKHVAEVATALVVPGQSVIAAGYPVGTSTAASALIRLGTIERISGDLIRSTCQLTVGDSGGGVFDLDGRLVGLNQRIGIGRSANIHATIRQCFEAIPLVKFSALLNSKAVVAKRLFGSNNMITAKNHALVHAWNARTLKVFGAVPNAATQIDSRILCHATLWSSEIAVTKLSELQKHTEVQLQTTDRHTVAATVIKEDRINDLAVLRLQESILLRDVSGPAQCGLYQLAANCLERGSRVGPFSGDCPVSLSVVGRIDVGISAVKSVLGCELEIVDHQLQINVVSANSAAAKAKLFVGDVVVNVDQLPIRSFEDFAARLNTLQPGDWSVFDVLRKGRQVTCKVQLQHDPATKLDRATFLDGAIRAASVRRTAFENALQHDGDLRPSEMGSPVLSIQGELLGINIAVRSRESIIAIPAKTVQALIDLVSD